MDKVSEILLLKSIVKELVEKIKKTDFLTYFKKLSIVSVQDNSISFWVISSFAKDNISFKFYKEIKAIVTSQYPNIQFIDFQVDSNIDNPSNHKVIDCFKEYKDLTVKKRKEDFEDNNSSEWMEIKTINDKYNFDNFIVWPSNQLPFSACEAVSRKPWASYNPLYIYWNVWLGKTHLLQATGNTIKWKFKDKKIIYTTADRFANDYITNVKKRTLEKMKEKYRSIDVLVIDDVQFLQWKESTQQELYNIFNILYESNKQIILSWDRAPRELTELEPRLRSRFEWWIIVDISAPDFETKLAILQEKARAREFIIPQEVAEFIAYNAWSNIRELEWILNQIIAEYELHNMPPTIENVAQRLNKLAITDSLLWTTKKNKMSIKSYDELIDIVSEHFAINKKDLLWDDRRKENMIPRQVAMYLLKNYMNYTLERIWNIFSGRNHSAVLYSCRKLELILKKNQNLFYEINVLRDKLWI
ncbi:MAG: chromosomal replication initiation protein [uncultured bacterium (gcode 4)]|uniref:Chromosomal replication initiator protein DnaA n=1 Tax=uncultured bacterium (gcode 4) TaxID=1234023 RepID=K2G1Y6_9BACT|nr:MAG: chromosomal replication initiation protein [uncultured bacterium (gcode 4)]